MSIADKLPEAPKGYRWDTGVTRRRDGGVYATVSLYLAYGGGLPEVYTGSLYASTLPTKEAILQGAEALLEQFRERAEEESARRAEQDALNEQYAHLLTD